MSVQVVAKAAPPAAKVRHAMILMPASAPKVRFEVIEERETVQLRFEDGIVERGYSLTLPEALALADMLSKTCKLVRNRPDWKP